MPITGMTRACSPMPSIAETNSGHTILAGPIALGFQWDGIRWSHNLAFEDRLIASSLEMDPERDDPHRVVSPAYQQFSHQFQGNTLQALLVGQWGHHHSSAVFTVALEDDGVSVTVDLAVRSRQGIEALAATYLVQFTSSHLMDASQSAVVWELDGQPSSRLRFEAREPGIVSLAEGGRQATTIQALARLENGASTQRLFYEWHWQSHSEIEVARAGASLPPMSGECP